MPVSYSVRMDLDGFRELFAFGQLRYTRKLGVLLAVVGLGMAAAMLAVLISAFAPEVVGYLTASVALGGLGVAMAIRPPIRLAGRKSLVLRGFCAHGAAATSGTPLEGLVADYQVTLDEHGAMESCPVRVLRTPWMAFEERSHMTARGTYFALRRGKDNSLAYNMLGLNWAFREEDVDGVLFVPAEVMAAHPGLADDLRRRIAAQRGEVARRGAESAAAQDLARWVRGA